MENTQLYPLLFDAIKDPLVIVDRTGHVRMANSAARSFFDMGSSPTLSNVKCVAPDVVFDGQEILRVMSQSDSAYDYRLKNSEGRECGVTLDIETINISDEDDLRLIHFHNRSGQFRTDLWKDEMISMVSHEIKNPLSAMKNSVDILLSQAPGELTEGQKRFLNTSGRSIDRLTHLLDRVLDVSRIGSGALAIEREWVDAQSFIKDVMVSFIHLYNVRRVHVKWNVDPSIQRVFIDPRKLEQIMINALSNSLKFTPEGGHITVAVSLKGVEVLHEDQTLLPWTDLGEPRLLHISIEDTGLGMTSDTLSNMFKRYHPTTRADGEHLGLSISKMLAEAQGGWIKVDSEVGIGTTVSVFVPCNQRTATVFSRFGQIRDYLGRYLAAKQHVTLYALGKQNEEDWRDICGVWALQPKINPVDHEDVVNEPFCAWTIDEHLAFAVLAGPVDQNQVKDVFQTQFIMTGEETYVFNGYAMGACHSPSEAANFTQLCNIAMTRKGEGVRSMMKAALAARVNDALECMVPLGGHPSEPLQENHHG